MASALPNTFRNIVHAFTEFLTVATHLILYERGLYPKTSFVSVRKYNIAVQQNRHPKVCEWINDAIASVEAQLLKGAAERVAVVIYSKGNEALERFVFDVSQLPGIPEADLDTTIVREGVDEEASTFLPVVDLDEHFRAVMNTIAVCPASLRALPQDCTFTVTIELRNDSQHHAPLSHPQAWVPARDESGASSDQVLDVPRPTTTALRTMRAGELRVEAWVEESAAKDKALAPQSITSGSGTSNVPSAAG